MSVGDARRPAQSAGRFWPRLVGAALAGLALSFAQAPYGWWPLLLPALAALFLLHRETGPARAGWLGFSAGSAYFAASLYWIAEAFFVDAARHGWMAPLAVGFMACGLALFWVLPFWLAARYRSSPLLEPLWLGVLWTASELARAYVLTGFPWALIAYAWVETPVAQLVSLTGPHGLGLLTLLATGYLAAAWTSLQWKLALPAVALVLLLAVVWYWGADRLSVSAPVRDTALRVRLVQPNAAQNEKWRPEMAPVFLARLLESSRSPAERPPDLIVWPETAIPWLLDEDPELRRIIADAAGGASVILGARRIGKNPDGRRRWFNSLFVLTGTGKLAAQYDKQHLVPFGEYVPLGGIFDRLGLTGLVGGSFAPGTGERIIQTSGLPPFQPLICYEAIFPDEMGISPRAEFIVQITNDAWFGSSIGPHQHFAQAQMRAIEQGLPLARAANTGISALIDPMGRVVTSLPLLSQGHIDAELPAALPSTLYSRLQDGPVVLLLLGLVVICITEKLRKRSHN